MTNIRYHGKCFKIAGVDGNLYEYEDASNKKCIKFSTVRSKCTSTLLLNHSDGEVVKFYMEIKKGNLEIHGDGNHEVYINNSYNVDVFSSSLLVIIECGKTLRNLQIYGANNIIIVKNIKEGCVVDNYNQTNILIYE